MFHSRCGESVKLSNNNKTASRNLADYNYGLVLSNEPLLDDELFEIKIDKKIYSWSGSLEIGVTSCSPTSVSLPPSATDLRNNTWILSGNSILKDGASTVEIYGVDLDKAIEGDRVGVMRTSQGQLVFYVNGVSYGIAAENIPSSVYAVVDLYGKVTQVTITSGSRIEPEEEAGVMTNLVASLDVEMNMQDELLLQNVPVERIHFHSRTGTLVKLSCNSRTAERLRPLDEFNNGVVMTHRPLQYDQLFEIRIDRLVEKWSGSIEVGVTTHNPNSLEFPATMTNMRSGTIMMSGCGILTNGKGTRREYGEFNLDELRVGDRIGMMCKSNGNLHLYINGLDQGVAATKVPSMMWGVVDLYGMTVKVTIVDRDEREEHNLITRRNTALRDYTLNDIPEEDSVDRLMFHTKCGGHAAVINNARTAHRPNLDMPEEDSVDRLMFHTKCGGHAAVINNARTAHRPNAMDDFNNGVVLTQRPLKPNELFEVRLDKMVTKWAGSIEIGVTTHSPTELEYPSTMTNVRSGTWMMTGNGVMHNGITIIDEYGQNLDRLQVGDRVGVVLKESGTLHFLVNGVDQGEAATNIPPHVYGVIDLYGQAAQATIVDYNCICCLTSPDTTANSLVSLNSRNRQSHSDLHFHHVHGRNARVSNGGRTASRPRALGEFNDAIVMSNRSLNEDEMFAVVVEKIVDRWSGSIEAGVTAIRPEDLELPGTMTDLDHDTWMLSGSSVMQNGQTMKHNYGLDLDTVQTGAVIGMKRHVDGTLHYYLDGEDKGEAWSGLPLNVYPVIDLYGQCAQVSIVSPTQRPREPVSIENSCSQTLYSHAEEFVPQTVMPNELPSTQHLHRLSPLCGKNITIGPSGVIWRNKQQPNYGLVFTALPLGLDDMLEVAVEQWVGQWAGSLAIGVTCMAPSDKAPPTITAIKDPTWYIIGDEVFQNNKLVRSHYCRSLSWLRIGARVGIKRCSDGTLHLFINGHDQGVAAHNVPKWCCYGILDLYGGTVAVRVTSKACNTVKGEVTLADPEEELSSACAPSKRDGQELTEEMKRMEDSSEKSPPDSDMLPEYCLNEVDWFQLHEIKGRNVQLSSGRLTAKRVGSYNQGVVLTSKDILKGQLFQVRIDAINSNWVSSLCIGVTSHPIATFSLPVTALGLKRDSWIICSDFVFHNGQKTKNKYGPNLDNVGVGRLVGVLVDQASQLHLYVDGMDQGVAATGIPPSCRVIIDVYGRCEQVTVVNPYEDNASALSLHEELHASIQQENSIDEDNIEGCADPVDFTAHEKADLESHEKEKECLVLVMEEPLRSKIDKTNENIQSSSLGHTTPSELSPISDMELDPKSIASNENLTLQQLEQQQHSEISRHIAQTNCDHKTSCDLANTSFVKSPMTSKPLVLRSLENSINSLASPAATISPLLKPNIDCDYFNACLRLKDTLGLPVGFFSRESAASCYCDMCHSHSSPQSKGEPPALYSVPAQWSRLPLRRRQRTSAVEVDHWHVAYTGTSLGAVRRILDLGELFTPEQLSLNQERSRKSKHDHSDTRQLVLSPTIKYAACSAFSPKHEYIDPKTKKRMVAYAAFQVLVRPGSYKVGPPSMSRVNKPVDPPLDHNSTEWVTKERNSTVLTALLLKLEQA